MAEYTCKPLFAIILALFSARMLRREDELLANPKLCRTCAYDLTGNVSGVCPECGAHIAA